MQIWFFKSTVFSISEICCYFPLFLLPGEDHHRRSSLKALPKYVPMVLNGSKLHRYMKYLHKAKILFTIQIFIRMNPLRTLQLTFTSAQFNIYSFDLSWSSLEQDCILTHDLSVRESTQIGSTLHYTIYLHRYLFA